jgi:hypothetical protein
MSSRFAGPLNAIYNFETASNHQCFHAAFKLSNQTIAGPQAVGIRPGVGELMHPVDRDGRRFIPFMTDGIKQVNIPGNSSLPAEAVGNRPAGPLSGVVKLTYPGIIERAGRHFGRLSGIGRKFVDPDNGDTDIGIRKGFDDGLEHRPGAHLASAGSGG